MALNGLTKLSKSFTKIYSSVEKEKIRAFNYTDQNNCLTEIYALISLLFGYLANINSEFVAYFNITYSKILPHKLWNVSFQRNVS